MAFIPTNRAVIGNDLEAIRQSLGLSTADALYLFGLSITSWMHTVRRDGEKELTDPTLALLVRFMDLHPEIEMLRPFPTAKDMHDFLNAQLSTEPKSVGGKGEVGISGQDFAVMLGSEGTAGYRWISKGGRQSAAVSRLLWHLDQYFAQAKDKKQLAKKLDIWKETVRLEGEYRNSGDVFATHKWKVILKKERDAERQVKTKRALADEIRAKKIAKEGGRRADDAI